MMRLTKTLLIPVAIMCAILGFYFGHTTTTTAQNQIVLPQISIDIPSVVDRVNPSVVSIVGSRRVRVADPFTGTVGVSKETVGGSGFIVSEDGLIVTNDHVVSEQGIKYTVVASDGKEYPMEVLGENPQNDIAVVKIAGKGLPYLSFADSSKLRLGETVIAIGNALGEFKNTVSVGVISGLGRSISARGISGDVEEFSELIQTDAAINPGNSGGPLLNSIGQVVGVNVAVAAGSQNIGFSIPANLVKETIHSFQP